MTEEILEKKMRERRLPFILCAYIQCNDGKIEIGKECVDVEDINKLGETYEMTFHKKCLEESKGKKSSTL
jgi:hypothetical protein